MIYNTLLVRILHVVDNMHVVNGKLRTLASGLLEAF